MTARPLHQQYIIYNGNGIPGGGGSDPDPAEFCPTHGYVDPETIEPPDPAVFCPINGYIPDPDVVVPEFPLPEATEESIIFICNAATSNWRDATIKRRLLVTGTNLRNYELYDTNENLLDSWTSTAENMDFDFPTNDRYYVVKIYVTDGTINAYYNSEAILEPHNYCIEHAIFNTPNIVGISFRGNQNFKYVEFNCSLNSLNSLYQFVQDCPQFKHFKWPQTSFPAMKRLDRAFAGSGISKLDLRELNIPGLEYMDYIVTDCKYLTEFHFMPVCYAQRMQYALSGTVRLIDLTMFTSAPNLGTGFANSALGFVFQNSAFEGEIVIPELIAPTAITSILNGCSYVQKIKFLGDWPQLTSASSAFAGLTSAVEIEAPRTVRPTAALASVFSTTTNAIKIYKGPDVGYYPFPNGGSFLESITGEHDTSGFSAYPPVPLTTNYRNTLHTFNCSKLRVASLSMGNSAANKFVLLTSVIIDWAGSSFSSTTSPQVAISADLDATELNRIFTELPTISNKTIDVRQCTGYATCNKTIAQAKGWTVM